MTNPYHAGDRQVYIVDGSRTPFLKTQGAPGPFSASDLAHTAARAMLTRLGVRADVLDEIVIGCVSSGPEEANIARVVGLRLGCPVRTPAMTVQRNCASGMQAIDTAALNIATGRSDIVLAGGTEAMSHHPVMLNRAMVTWLATWSQARSIGARGRALLKLRLGHFAPIVAILKGLTDPVVGLSMGQTAEILATDFGIDRKQMDAFAVRSHQRLAAAYEAGALDEIEPLYDTKGNVYTVDDGLRPDSSLDKLARLRPVFDRPVGRVTAGNSAQITDGAAMLLLASGQAVAEHDLPVMGRLLDSEWAGLDPKRMGLGPVYAMAPIMERNGLNSDDIDAWEINEAFAAQVLACLAAWKDPGFCRESLGRAMAFDPINQDRLNQDGGGISLGHPVGASGARIVLHLLKTLRRSSERRGMAGICIGGGQGGAMLVEQVEGIQA